MSIFESKEKMTPIEVESPEVVHTAMTRAQAQNNETPALFDRIKDAHVRNLAPVHRGKHY
jgi:hypothetical protein